MTPRLPLKIAFWTVILAALLAVFTLYTEPEFLLTLANQVWSCF
jgi:hypothetical protein